MFVKLREIFVRQHIGAILIALFVWQGAVELVTRIARIVYWYLNTLQSVLSTSRGTFPWENLIFSLVSIALYVLAALALVRWLYVSDVSALQKQPETTLEQS